MEDERDAEDAIRALDRIEFGRKERRLRVEWTKVICMCLIFFWEAPLSSYVNILVLLLLTPLLCCVPARTK